MRKDEIDSLIEIRGQFSIDELMEETGCTRRSLIRWMQRKAKPQRENRRKIRKFLAGMTNLDTLVKIKPGGHELRELREAKGLSVSQFARELGMSAMAVYKWEKGTSKPSPLAREKLNQIFSLEIALTARDKYRKIKGKWSPEEKQWLFNCRDDFTEYSKRLDLLYRKHELKEIDFKVIK